MASKTTINFDDEMEAALAELVEHDGTKTVSYTHLTLPTNREV